MSKSLTHRGTPTALPLHNFCSCTVWPYQILTSTALSNIILYNILPFRLPWNMAIQVHNQSAQTNATRDNITYIKGTQWNSVQCYFLTKKPTEYSTGMMIIRPTPITLLSYSIFSRLKRNGLQLTSPQFILATEQPLSISGYKLSRKIGSNKTYFSWSPTTSTHHYSKDTATESFSQFHSGTNVSHMGENKTLCRIWLWFSCQASEKTSLHRSKAELTAYHIMYGGTRNKNFILIGQWKSHSIPCTSTSMVQLNIFQIIQQAVIYWTQCVIQRIFSPLILLQKHTQNILRNCSWRILFSHLAHLRFLL